MRSGSWSRPIRFNREYFGFIAGYPEGDILLLKDSAEPLLQAAASASALTPHLLTELHVPHGFHLNTPPLVWVELTRKCNLSCPHCYIDGGLAREHELPTSFFTALLDEMSEMGVWAVALTGGEPTLHSGFAELVNHARSRQLLVGVATNGMFLTQALLDSLPRDGVIISISLDDLHLLKANREAEFKLVSQAILRCHAMGFLTNIMTNTNSANLDLLPRLMGWAEEHGVSVRSIPFSPLGRGKRNAWLQNSPADAEKAAEFWIREVAWEHEYHRRAGLCVGSIFNYGLSLAYMTRRCSSGRFLGYVCADGTMYPCTMCAGEQVLSPGRIREGQFASMWRSHWQIRDFCWDNFQSTCNGCPINEPSFYCSARCPAMSYARHGEFFNCGAGDFEKVSTVIRTAVLERTPLARSDGQPLSLTEEPGDVAPPKPDVPF